MVKVDKFCGCCPLKTGAFILGIGILIWGFILGCFGSVGLMCVTLIIDIQLPLWNQVVSGLGQKIDFDKNFDNDFDNDFNNDFNKNFDKDFTIKIDAGERKKIIAFFVIIMTLGIIDILAASSLLFGAGNIKPNFLVPTMILFPVDLALWISIIILWFTWFGIVFLVILSLLYVYFWVCIFSYWKQIKEEPGNAFGNWETPGVVHEARTVQETTAD